MGYSKLIICAVILILLSTGGWAGDLDLSQASYSVPVPSSLINEASFPLETVNWTTYYGQQLLVYRLPADLVGGEIISVQFSGTFLVPNAGFSLLTGLWGHTACKLTTNLACLTQYDFNMLFGDDRAEALKHNRDYLTQKYGNDPDLQKRIAVAMAFGNDPGGVVSIPSQANLRERTVY